MLSARALRAAVAAALFLCAAAGVATAQTVIVRKAPPGAAVETSVNGTAGGTATVNPAGDAVITVAVPGLAGAQRETEAFLFVDVCGPVYRVLIVEKSAQTPPHDDKCQRHDLPGVFVVRRVSSLVFDVSGTQPTVLLRQGRYSLKPPRVWKPAPTGLVVFGAAGLGKLGDASLIACGTVEGCKGDDSGLALTAGAAYWLTKWLGAEVSYTRPAKPTATADAGTYKFTHTVDAEIVNIAAKAGAAFGPSRIYGSVGTTWHRALSTSTQTTGSITDGFELQTEGWGWSWGAGYELWLASSFALYTEGGSLGLKGDSINETEGSIDSRYNYVLAGLRVRIGRRR